MAKRKAKPAGKKLQWLKNYPEGIKWDAAFRGEAVNAMFDRSVAKYGDHAFSYFLGRERTYREVGALVDKAAAGLQSLGIGKGKKVGLLLPNSVAFVMFYYGTLKAGGTVVNLNPLYSTDELSFNISDSEADIVVTVDLKVLFSKLEPLIENGTIKKAVVCPFREELPALKGFLFGLLKRSEIADISRSPVRQSIVPLADLIANVSAPGPVRINPDKDLAVLQYTGGTTGLPKGAMLSHANLTINVQQVRAWFPQVEEGSEKILAVLPFFHVFAMTGILNFGVFLGAEIIMMPRFELKDALKLIKTRRPTIFPGVPTLFNAIMNSPDARAEDMNSLKHCISGGAPLPLDVRLGFEKIADCKLIEGYGLSETSPVITANPLSGVVKENSIGQPLPATYISVRDVEKPTREMPLGESGEICAKGPQVMSGYWKQPGETKAAFTDGYFRTGDVGYMDEDGFFYIVDRLKDIIICSGYNVYPRHVEDAIYKHPSVEEVTVIGVPDDYRGEAPKAFVKIKDGKTLDAEELRRFLKTLLSPIEVPDQIEFRDELPKTLIGKLSKKELREESG